MESLKLNITEYDQDILQQKTDPKERLKIMRWLIMSSLFDQFEKHERGKLHEEESEKMLIDILGDIAKAKVEKKNSITSEFYWLSTHTFLGDDYGKEWTPIKITSSKADELFREKSDSEYYHAFTKEETILSYRAVGVWRKVIFKLLKKRKLKLTLDKRYEGGHGGAYKGVLIISW